MVLAKLPQKAGSFQDIKCLCVLLPASLPNGLSFFSEQQSLVYGKFPLDKKFTLHKKDDFSPRCSCCCSCCSLVRAMIYFSSHGSFCFICLSFFNQTKQQQQPSLLKESSFSITFLRC